LGVDLKNGSSTSPPSSTARQLVGRSKCAVCKHPERWRIELLKAGGASLNSLAQKFGVSRDSIDRHWHRHVSPETKASYLCGPAELASLAGKAAQEGDSVLDYLRMCRVVLTSQLSAASEAGDTRGAAYVTGALVKVLETIARVTGEIGELARSTTYNFSTTTNVALLQDNPVFASLQATMLRALGPYPEARNAVVQALRSLHGEQETPVLSGTSPTKVVDHEPV
jgi:hypothetical protein